MIGFAVVEAAEIRWKPETRVLIAEGGGYARIARLSDGDLLCAYSRRGEIFVKRSGDDGGSWEDERSVGSWSEGAVTNAELLVRDGGEVWCFFNRRPDRDSDARYAVGYFRSTDGGRTWGDPEVLYEAGRTFENGCWEPVGLELPDGGLHVYFANEGPYRDSNEQEISLMRSRDGGATWRGPEAVSFRAGSRDGMPVPALLPEVEGIALAIEDNGLRGGFKPVIVASTWKDGGWPGGPVGGDSPRRWAALAEPLDPEAYAGAPYLCRVRAGVTVLSFQLAENGEMRDSRMAVSVGDGRARDFGEPDFPFPEGAGQLWNSLFVKDEETVTAVTGARLDGRRGIWAVDGVVE